MNYPQAFCRYVAVLFFFILAAPAHAQMAAGNWELTEPSGGPAIGSMVLSRDGSINFDGTIGSWTQSGNRITATVYGSEKLRAAGTPIADLDFQVRGDAMSGTMHNLVNNKTADIAARRQVASAPQANNTNSGYSKLTPGELKMPPPCGPPGSINDCIRARPCARGETRVDGRCVPVKITCLAPYALQNGRCVAPASSAAGDDVPGSARGGSGRDAKECIVIRSIPEKDGRRASQSITNNCSEKIGLHFCHGPSSKPGTKDTECGQGGRYYQQFSTMEPGQTKDNFYSMPIDATIEFAACFGGESKIRQTTNGQYICK